MTDYILKSFIGLACAGVFGAAVEYVKRSLTKQKVIETEIKALAHDALFRCCRELMRHDEIEVDELENLEYLFRGYSGLGLNGTGEKIYHQIKAKKVVERRKDYA